MLIINDSYNFISNIMNEDEGANYNWYSVRAKNAKGSVIIEFHMSVKSSNGMDKEDFFEIVREEIKNPKNAGQYDDTESNIKCEHDYDKFEILALDYLNENLGGNVFRRVGGNNGSKSDLVLRCNNKFWIECKMSPEARAGQFTVKATKDGVKLNSVPTETHDQNVDPGDVSLFAAGLTSFVDAAKDELSSIYEICNKDPLKFFNYISNKEQIPIKSEVEHAVAYVKANYSHKNVKYFITASTDDNKNYIIVPLGEIENVFDIQAICRFKRYNAKVVPGKYSDNAMKIIYSALNGKKYGYKEDRKWYKNYGAVKINSGKRSFEIEVPDAKAIGIEGPITLVFDRKDSVKISGNRQPARKK